MTIEEQYAQQVLDGLTADAAPFRVLKSFSDKPGIYAVYLCGSEPLRICESLLQPCCLLYIGKTESSQQERDAEQHFASGKSGGSTLRRSLGALLRTQLKLTPQPRSQSETSEKRFTNYKFDDAGEDRLTSWMTENLALSFYEYAKPPAEIEKLEAKLIAFAVPPLNILSNSRNPHMGSVRAARAECAGMARGQQSSPSRPASTQSRVVNLVAHPTRDILLHEAMIVVLEDCPGCVATFGFVASKIAELGLYRQKLGGQAPASQIRLRAKNKPRLFDVIPAQGGEPAKVRLKR